MKKFIFGFCLVVVVVLSYQKMNRTRALVEASREQPVRGQQIQAPARPEPKTAAVAKPETKGGMSIWSHTPSDLPVVPGDARVVPPTVGSWDAMWSGLREVDRLAARARKRRGCRPSSRRRNSRHPTKSINPGLPFCCGGQL